jgi:hypothetical protein
MKKQTEKQTKSVFKVIWAWQDEKEEQWLEQQALQGWHLIEVAPFFYRFQRGMPRRVIYRLDYKGTLDKDYQEYLTIFQDSGWELVTRLSNWHYYRLEPENDRVPELYSSNRTKAEKYRRLLIGLLIPMALLAWTLNPIYSSHFEDHNGVLQAIYFASVVLRFVIMAFLLYGLIRIIRRIHKLESDPRE